MEDLVREPVVAHEPPDILDRVGFQRTTINGWVTAIDNQDALLVSIYAKTYTRNARGQITATGSNRANQAWTTSTTISTG